MTESASPEERPIFIARKLRQAKALEALFQSAGIEYDVEPDEYMGGIVFRTMRTGAFFYVDEETRERASAVMVEHGFTPMD